MIRRRVAASVGDALAGTLPKLAPADVAGLASWLRTVRRRRARSRRVNVHVVRERATRHAPQRVHERLLLRRVGRLADVASTLSTRPVLDGLVGPGGAQVRDASLMTSSTGRPQARASSSHDTFLLAITSFARMAMSEPGPALATGAGGA